MARLEIAKNGLTISGRCHREVVTSRTASQRTMRFEAQALQLVCSESSARQTATTTCVNGVLAPDGQLVRDLEKLFWRWALGRSSNDL